MSVSSLGPDFATRLANQVVDSNNFVAGSEKIDTEHVKAWAKLHDYARGVIKSIKSDISTAVSDRVYDVMTLNEQNIKPIEHEICLDGLSFWGKDSMEFYSTAESEK